MTETIQLYVIMSQDGKFYRSKGYGGHGSSWVDSLSKAKIYPRPGPAKSQITFWATSYPEYGCPKLIVLEAGIKEVIPQEQRLETVIKKGEEKKKKRELESAESELARASRQLQRARSDFETALKGTRQ